MDYPTVRFPTDSTDSAVLEAAAALAAEDPSIRHAEVVDGFGNGLDIKVVLERDDAEDAARDAVERSLPAGVRIEIPPAPTVGDAFPG
jgi:phage tail protein X